MPLIVQIHHHCADTPRYFAKVLSDQSALQQTLAQADDSTLLVEAIFNGQPVALMLGTKQAEGCLMHAVVVHPATRGRNVGTELLQKGSALLPRPIAWHDDLREWASRVVQGG